MIKVKDIAHVRLRAPDLDKMERFLLDFGLARSARSDDALYMRGTDPEHHVHITERGEPGFVGMAFEAASADDLRAVATIDGASDPTPIDEPGGGTRVEFTDPNGFRVEIVHGIQRLDRLPLRPRTGVNDGSTHGRLGELKRMEPGPGQVKRLGHLVLFVRDFRESEAWYKSRFGFLTSDEAYLGKPEDVIMAFMRCDQGDAHVDHHTFVCAGTGEPGFNHAAFEVEDLDDIMLGHQYLTSRGHEHAQGVGRHLLGSQIFDYWKDPWGNMVEHWTDGDLLTAHTPPATHTVEAALGSQWGPAVSP